MRGDLMKIETGLLSLPPYSIEDRYLVLPSRNSFFLFLFGFFKSESRSRSCKIRDTRNALARVCKATLQVLLVRSRVNTRESYASDTLARAKVSTRLFASRADITFNGPLIQF